MRVLFAVVEMSPLAKVGGLADVAGSLPKALVAAGHDVRVILPMHAGIQSAEYGFRRILADVAVETPRGSERASVWIGEVGGVTTYLVEAMDLFERPNIYGEPDDAQRWLFFCDALLATVPALQWMPEVLHLHDWHTAFAIMRLRANPQHPLARAALVYTIHNLALRGDFDQGFADANALVLPRAEGIPADELRNPMAAGILGADVISTVSETYAREVQTPEYGAGLDALLRGRADDLFGIVNGIDPTEFDPATDTRIPVRFSADDRSGKLVNKAALQTECGLPVVSDVPLIGMVNRLFWQKGADIAADALAHMLAEMPLQFVMLGSGDARYEEALRDLERRYPQAVKTVIGFDLAFAQRVYAGSDLFLMPSRYEPCGLGQMIAMRYGSVPVVRRTGGLADTVPDDDQVPGAGVGFAFDDADGAALADALRRALRAYTDRDRWDALMLRGMTRDLSWAEAAGAYVAMYEAALQRVSA